MNSYFNNVSYTYLSCAVDWLTEWPTIADIGIHASSSQNRHPFQMHVCSLYLSTAKWDILLTTVHECILCVVLVHIMYDLYCFRLIKMGHLQVVPFYPHFCPKSMFFPSYSIAIQSNCNQMTLIDTTTHDTCMVWILKRLRISSEQTSNRLSWMSLTLASSEFYVNLQGWYCMLV